VRASNVVAASLPRRGPRSRRRPTLQATCSKHFVPRPPTRGRGLESGTRRVRPRPGRHAASFGLETRLMWGRCSALHLIVRGGVNCALARHQLYGGRLVCARFARVAFSLASLLALTPPRLHPWPCLMHGALPRLLLLLLHRCANAQHSHLFRVTGDLPSLLTPSASGSSGRRLEDVHEHEAHQFAEAPGVPAFELAYSAQQAPRHTLRLLEPTLARIIESISCNGSSEAEQVTIVLNASVPEALDVLSRRISRGAVVSGACGRAGADGARPFYSVVSRWRVEPPRTVHLLGVPTGLHAAFDSLELSFAMGSAAATRSSASPPRRRLFLDRIFGGSGRGALNDLGEGLVDGAGALVQAVRPRHDAPRELHAARTRHTLRSRSASRSAAGSAMNVSHPCRWTQGGRLVSRLVSGALDGFSDSTAGGVRSHWLALSASLRALFDGFSFSHDVSTTAYALNYDSATRRAANRSLRLYHSPWVTCSDCFFHAEVT
jgi:hypothetical protein